MANIAANMPQLDLATEQIPNKYFRFMKTPEESWKPYRNIPMYDDHPEFGYFKSSIGVTQPREGDYLVQEPDGSLYVLRPTNEEAFEDVEFDAMPPLEDLLEQGIVVETPDAIRKLDCTLRDKMLDLSADLALMEDVLMDLQNTALERRFGFPTKAAREAKHQIIEVKAKMASMCQEYDELDAELKEKVLKPLSEQDKTKSKIHSLDSMISHASVRTQPQQGITQNPKSFDRE